VEADVMNHYDVHHAAYARNVGRLLHGHLLTVGPEDREQVVCIDRVKQINVGIDDTGIYCGVLVYDTNNHVWALYSDGTIEDVDDDYSTVGRHDLSLRTLRTVEKQEVL
jgi:hypothetical protein